MYDKVDNRIYTPEEIAGKTFHQGNKPEPLFTLNEMKDAFDAGYATAKRKEWFYDSMARYFQSKFNITI